MTAAGRRVAADLALLGRTLADGVPRGARGRLWALIAVGTAVRVVVAMATYGVAFDIDSYHVVASLLDDHPLDLYSATSRGGVPFRWPYPPGYLPWLATALGIDKLTPLPMQGVVQLPAIAADAALAYLVAGYLGLRGAGARACLLAGALVALGPLFGAVSGYHGQFDSLAMLPALAALVLWDRPGARDRALTAGLLIGVGAALKTYPALMVIALLPTARDRREAVRLVGSAIAVPLLALLPFVLADPGGVLALRHYQGVPGLGGLSLVVQPGAAEQWVRAGVIYKVNAANERLLDAGGWLLAAGLAALAVALVRRRVPALVAAQLLWLLVPVLTVSYGARYLVWTVPVLLMAGRLRAAALAQAVALPLLVITYGFPFESSAPAYVYVPLALGLWGALLAGFAAQARRSLTGALEPA